jgi:GTP cyclohydrolase II
MHMSFVRKKVIIPIKQGLSTFMSFGELGEAAEHVAIAFGAWESKPAPLVRMHSECLTGDIFASAKCDCGEQLQEALNRLAAENGVLLYLRQEGRGIGLYNKLDAYELQAQGLDTYEANRQLGFNEDLRDYAVAARMLRALGIQKVRLLSNNPDKKKQLEDQGIEVVELVRTGVFVKEANRKYLEAKVRVTQHKMAIHLEKVS